ncbi:hypothetical protein, partial [Klebsiella pneumoniae]
SKEHPEGKPASMPFKFDVLEELDPQNLTEMLPIMRRLTKDPHIVAIRGKCLAPKDNVRRTRGNFNVSNPSHIIAMDVDGIVDTGGYDKFNLVGMARHI